MTPSDLPECNLCLNIQLTPAFATGERASKLLPLLGVLAIALASKESIPFSWLWYLYALYCHCIFFFFKCLEISGNNGTDTYLFIHTLLSPGVRLRWKLREPDKDGGISKKEATNEQSGRSNFFLVHRAGIVFIWVRRQIIFHVDDTW